MKKKPLISIIVPIYNVDKYLKKCIDSLLNQTYKNLEIILVDDGSTDNSGKICDEYSKRDNRIIVFHQKNSGVSTTRNKGLEISTGEYIGFVDPDDYISPIMYDVLYNILKQSSADISMCDYECFDSESINFCESKDFIIYDKKQALCELVLDRNITSHLWNKLYKSELFDGIKFPENKIYEDVGTIYLVIEKANKIIHNKSVLYAYYQRPTSLCNTISENRISNYIEMVNNRYNYLLLKFPELKKVLQCSRIKSSLVFNFVIAKDKNIKLFNSKIIIDDFKENIKIKLIILKYIELKFILALLILKINRNLFYKIFSIQKKVKI